MRGYFGLANQLTGNTTGVAEALEPLRSLLSTKNDCLWTADHDRAFQESREKLCTTPTLAYFDLKKETRMLTDASKTGLGFLLQQRHGEKWRTVQAGSRFLADAETRYAVIEQEMLGVAWSTMKCKYLLKGLPHFEVVTDHAPLVPILNSHRLDEIENPRLQRLGMKMAGYIITARWQKGALNEAADALSRHPDTKPEKKYELAELDLSLKEIRAVQLGGEEEKNLHLQELREHAAEDEDYQELARVIKEGFPSVKSQLPDCMKPLVGEGEPQH